MFTATQCQKPETIGASGSKQVTTKLLVSSGKPDLDSCGDTFWPPALSCTWVSASCTPSLTSVDVTWNEPTFGSNSYGSGATGRSRPMGFTPLRSSFATQ